MNMTKGIEYSERLVAFIDILGFSQIISSDTANDIENIKFFDSNLRHVVKILKDEYGKIFSIKMFSDCICLSCEYDPEKFEYILSELSFIQLYFSINGIFIRGGFSIGLHFENENLIYSKGLIQAYELKKKSIYPRILIGNEVVKRIKNENNNNFIMKSPDGQYFIDYLDSLNSDGMEIAEFLLLHKTSIINQIKINKSNTRIAEKYKWLSLYHNTKANEFFDIDDQKELSIDMNKHFQNFEK